MSQNGPTATELVVDTRFAESRLTAALTAKLVARTGAPGDVALATRDIDPYEEPLVRAARRHGVTVTAWTQLRLKRTRPFRLVASVCDALDAETLPLDTLLDPLVLGWTPPEAEAASEGDGPADDTWPLSEDQIETARLALGSEGVAGQENRDQPDTAIERDPAAWRRRTETAGLGAVATFCAWLEARPTSPSPAQARETLTSVIERFRARVLPDVKANDASTLRETEETARAVARLVADPDPEDGLLADLEATYGEWVSRGAVERSWTGVGTVCEELATQAPGRREHSNANAVDLLEANDIWERSFPYVVALGLVDGVWPQRPQGALPRPVRARIEQGADPAAQGLAVRAAWTESLDRDHFADVVDAAETHLFVCRFTQDGDGVAKERSPLLDGIETERLSREAQHELLDPDRGLPTVIERRLAPDHRSGEVNDR